MPDAPVRVLVLRAAGTNCDRELAHAFHLAGATPDTVHINTLVKNPDLLKQWHILAIPGGFSYGDDIASGKILANQLTHHLGGALGTWLAQRKPIIGICNGFQVLVKAGILPGPLPQLPGATGQTTTLTHNVQGRFVDRPVYLRSISRKCIWLPEGLTLRLPIAHGEGRFITATPAVLEALRANDQVVLEYTDEKFRRAQGPPDNPNGSVDAIAGICDATGCVLGLMPHPERFCEPLADPLRHRQPAAAADGLIFFRQAVAHVRRAAAEAESQPDVAA